MATIRTRTDKRKVLGRARAEIRRIDARMAELRDLYDGVMQEVRRRWVRKRWCLVGADRSMRVLSVVTRARALRTPPLRAILDDDDYWDRHSEARELEARRERLTGLATLCLYGDSTKVELTWDDVDALGFKIDEIRESATEGER